MNAAPRRSVLPTLILSLMMLVAGIAVMGFATHGFRAFTSQTARAISVAEHPRPVPPAALESQRGTQFTFSALHGRWVVVDFIYTRCFTLCTLMGSQFAQLQQQLATPIAAHHLELLSISFDPKHDRPPELVGYLNRFGSRGTGWLAAVPHTRKGLSALERTFGITVVPDGEGGFVHNDGFEIVDPAGRLVDILGVDAPVTEIVKIVRQDLRS